jgi:hypothetical protein
MKREFALLIILTSVFANTALLAHITKPVMAQQETTIETQLFSYQITVPGREIRAPNIVLAERTRVRIKFDANESLSFFCQDSNEYSMSASHSWSLVWYHWDDETAHMDRTYTIPTTDTWYFTLANYGYNDINVFNVTLSQLTTYKLKLTSDKAYYHKGEQVALTANATRNDEPVSGLNVTIRVLDPSGNTIFDQTNETNMYGQVGANFTLPGEEGTYNATVQTSIEGRTIEGSVTFAIDETPPVLNIILPKNGTWVPSSVSLTFNTSEPISWVAYSLNDSANVTISGNATLSGLSSGTYNIVLYATDMAGNNGHSSEIFFNVDTTSPSTLHDYDGLWHTSNYTTTLTAVDELSGVAETYYRINNGATKSVSVDGQPCFHITQANSIILIDGNISDWLALGLSPIGTDPPNNVGDHDISSDLLEAWAYTDTENLYLAMKVNGGGFYNYDNVEYQIYLNTDTETYKVKYFHWYDDKGYGYLFYWDEGSEIWQTRIPSLEAHAGPGGYIEWKVPYFDSYGMRALEYNSTLISLRFTTFDNYYGEEVNSIRATISLPDLSSLEGYAREGINNKLEYWSVDKAGNEEQHHFLSSIKLDKTGPTIGNLARTPDNDVQPNQQVTISVDVTDSMSGVENVRLIYNANNSALWLDFPMTRNTTTGFYEYIISGQQADTLVKYKITAYDRAGNSVTDDNAGQYYAYTVIPEFPSFLLLPLFMLTTLIATVLLKKKRRMKP